jgi:predicted RNA binding protein YcfA (HicA-like mRNA interferase family)
VTPKVPAVKAEQLVRVAEHLSFEFRRQRGSHAIDVRPTDQARVVIPRHGGELKRKTLRAIIQDLKITVEKFRELL